ncbi:hypothetical protein CMEL01_12930 [Colletotrichum melonis]|uniref:Uncharacterized protein n=1 Tax=Colletotrichum melonis TaxID=1209925 RepID=A0AAI9UT02_9PEZI|nr:hypothetical protein CMEL01_12930 [Colletotrichum melonis]
MLGYCIRWRSLARERKQSLRLVYAHYGIPRVRETAFTPAHDGSPHAAGFSAR